VCARVISPIRTVAARACPCECDAFKPGGQSQKRHRNMKNKSAIAILAASLRGRTFAFADSGVPKTYPLKKCVVSDEGFDHGKAVKVTAPDGTDVYLCCKDCVKDFKKEPAKYAKMVKDAQLKK